MFWRERDFIQRDVYTNYFGYTAKMGGYTKLYIPPIWDDMRSIADIPTLYAIAGL